jgi:RNA polymerase sigma factor (sigma-70 family)
MVSCDEIWVQRFIAGDKDAFENIINQYKALVFAIILRLVQDPDEAQDIAQEVFLQIYRSLPDYRPDNLKAWIGKIATNKAIDWKRRQGKYQWDDDSFLTFVADERDGPEEVVLKQEKSEYIRGLCKALPGLYGRVLIKYHFENKSYQQIAREEGISVKTVESRLYWARKMLKNRWEEGVG